MWVRTLERFKDKHTDDIHKVNDEFEVSEERLKEILTKGKLVEVIEKPTRETPEGQAEEGGTEELTEEQKEEKPEEGAEVLEQQPEVVEETAGKTTAKTQKSKETKAASNKD